MTTPEFTLLGSKRNAPIDSEELETFPKPEGLYEVEFTTRELTSLCPITGQPDIYTLTVRYTPAALCLEAKSVKLYLHRFRNIGVFAEELAVVIAQDLQRACGATTVSVEAAQQVRGGLSFTARASAGPRGDDV
ncbi:preQ(1) synthase [Streptomyces sp. NPDC001820]|uniref:preQ(1) synthase n=1 Tax=Streptomyces sp. NPDC001820 TaxID=3364613 RepID=UPI0036915D6C